MKIKALLFIVFIGLGCKPKIKSVGNETAIERVNSKEHLDKPKVSFTFDDGITTDIATFKFPEWNDMILSSLKKAEVNAVFFVTGSNKSDKKGKQLLESWSQAGHQIANHTYSHPNFNNEKMGINDFEEELVKTDEVISSYDTYTKLFRFPYLKEGNTNEKIVGFRKVLRKHGYKNGSVTIDASDWYINSELIKYIQKEGRDGAKIEDYRQFYLKHILERAEYYEDLSYDLTNRHIKHTLLLHHNLSSALFLGDLIQEFKNEGWDVISASESFKDDFFKQTPTTNPAGESLVWSVAKETGNYADRLRYPAEDSRYEMPKMKRLGL